jgi:hypothetical protein
LVEVGAQLLGQQHRHRGEGALPHLDLVDDQGDDAIAVDADEGVVGQARPPREARWRPGRPPFRRLLLAVVLPGLAVRLQPNSVKPNSRPPPATAPAFMKPRRDPILCLCFP